MDKKLSKVRARLGLKKLLSGVACVLMASCVPSPEEIQKKVDEVPSDRQHSLVLDYDKVLLHNIDSLANLGIPLEDAIEKSQKMTWNEEMLKMSPNQLEWSGEDWIIKAEADKQLEASREEDYITVMVPVPRSVGKMITVVMEPRSQIRHVYKPEYRDQLAKEIQSKENNMEKQTKNLKVDVSQLKDIQNRSY